MADYFTLETVRDELIQAGTLNVSFVGGTFPQDWKYCPCVIVENCTRLNNIICSPPIYVGIYIRTPHISMPIVVEIIYERETRRGFVRANNMKINDLLDKKVLHPEALRKVTMPF
jgi:hypothetical protein